jgi:formate dehydrogenase subunit gamma
MNMGGCGAGWRRAPIPLRGEDFSMAIHFARLGRFAAVMSLMLLVFAAAPSMAQEPVNPTAQSVQEQQLLEALQGGQSVSGRVSIPDQRAAELIKPEGKAWSATNSGTLLWVTTVIVLGTLALLAVFYFVRGRIRVEHGFAGRTIKRFNSFERFAHWLSAICFILLALTGLNLIFGRYVLIPLFGPDTFAAATQLGKFIHNYVAWPFMIGITLMFLVWVKDNIPGKLDMNWIKQGGGIFKKGVHPPARRFNAGQKIIFWSVVLGGAALSFTGVLLMFPEVAGSPGNWQLAQIVHGVGSAIMVAVILGHIYIGTLGMEGAFDAMGKGEVDVNWAREHHSLWAAEAEQGVPADHVHPAPRGVAPAE